MDQQVFAPASSQTLTAALTQPTTQGDYAILSATFSVDGGSPITATVVNNGTSNNINYSTLTAAWNSSGALNPSEHTVVATAQVQFQYEGPPSGTVYTISSTAATAPVNGPYPPDTFYGDGRAADFIIANLQLQSFQFNSPITPDKNDGTSVPVPQFVLDQSGNSIANYPSVYLKGSTPNFSFGLFPLTGSGVTTGFRLSLTAAPNTTDPALTLYDNTGAATPEVFKGE